MNFRDPFGLLTVYTQEQVSTILGFSEEFANSSCYTVSLLNQLSDEYSNQTGQELAPYKATEMIQAAIDKKDIDPTDARILDNENVADSMWSATGLPGEWDYEYHDGYYANGDYEVFERPGHFEGSAGGDNTVAFDPDTGKLDNVSNGYLDDQEIVSTREFTYSNCERSNE